MIRRIPILIILSGLLALCCSCSDRAPDKSKPVAQINEYVLGTDEFRETLSRSAYFHGIVGVSTADKKRILEEEIRKELLIQEAIKQGLDKETEFRQTIERYWEQTLIASLIKRQCASIRSGIIVTEDEIDDRYKKTLRQGTEPPPPLTPELKERLESEIRDEKQTKALEGWTEELLKRAKVTVYEENLGSLN